MWESDLARIGAFRCQIGDACFHDSGPAQNWCFVFPRTAVGIQHEHERVFTANPNVVTFYNCHQAYRRTAIGNEGDRCDWFGVHPNVARDAVRAFDPNVDDRPESPFRFTRAWSESSTYLLQRRLFRAVSTGEWRDPFAIEEAVVLLLDRVLRYAYLQTGDRDTAPPRNMDAVREIETILSRRLSDAIHLNNLAKAVNLSVFHLCRIFRRATGSSMHQYRHRLRVLSCLEPVCETRKPVVDIAMESGFHSHSHFTAAFRREFAQTPSRARF